MQRNEVRFADITGDLRERFWPATRICPLTYAENGSFEPPKWDFAKVLSCPRLGYEVPRRRASPVRLEQGSVGVTKEVVRSERILVAQAVLHLFGGCHIEEAV